MNKFLAFFCLFLATNVLFSQQITGPQLLEKAIQYHDPNGNWDHFKSTFKVVMETPKQSDRVTTITIDLPQEYFYSDAVRDTISTQYTVEKDSCTIVFCGKKDFSEATAKKYGLSCERAKMYKNYYTYLYGLPMKLKDKGTIIHDKVQQKTFKGKDYLVLRVTYLKSVGTDIWYFYFDPKTYAMEVYQFFKDESKNDGEYILLTEEETMQDIKFPKKRAWYYNKDDKYLGTDILEVEK